jgi:hypothetical protein
MRSPISCDWHAHLGDECAGRIQNRESSARIKIPKHVRAPRQNRHGDWVNKLARTFPLSARRSKAAAIDCKSDEFLCHSIEHHKGRILGRHISYMAKSFRASNGYHLSKLEPRKRFYLGKVDVGKWQIDRLRVRAITEAEYYNG